MKCMAEIHTRRIFLYIPWKVWNSPVPPIGGYSESQCWTLWDMIQGPICTQCCECWSLDVYKENRCFVVIHDTWTQLVLSEMSLKPKPLASCILCWSAVIACIIIQRCIHNTVRSVFLARVMSAQSLLDCTVIWRWGISFAIALQRWEGFLTTSFVTSYQKFLRLSYGSRGATYSVCWWFLEQTGYFHHRH